MFDLGAERKRLEKEIAQSQTEVARLEVRLNDEAFLTKAPAAIVDKERDKMAVIKDKLERLKQQDLGRRCEIPADYYTYAGEIPWCDTYPCNGLSELNFVVGTSDN